MRTDPQYKRTSQNLDLHPCRWLLPGCDKNSADGMVTSQNYENFKKTHFSGLSRNKEYTSAQIVSEIKKYYEPEDVKKLSLVARKEFDIDIVLKSLLDIYAQSIAHPPKELSKNTKDAVRQILELINAENLYAAQELRKFQDSKLYNVWRGYEVLKKLTKLQKR